MKLVFDSRNKYFKNPVGAVEKGTNIHFRITLPRTAKCSAAYLMMRDDKSGNDLVSSLYWCGMDGYDHETWECDFTPKTTGLFWYRFEIDTINGRQSILRCFGSEGRLSPGEYWQLTVYEKDFKTPDWLTGGVMYQIFPDRFYNSRKEKNGIPEDRKLREDWGGEPEWKPNNEGKVTNSDYFGGDLLGITEKLDYIKSLGVTCIYLNPIFEAHSNHRYNTADYSKIDPCLGNYDDFKKLCNEAKRRNIRIILDGVFSHTGSDSIYFNREKRYESLGAFNSKDSEYYDWYHFIDWPEKYHSWWGFETLPELEKTNYNYNMFINGPKGIIRKWLKAGASGWRLDVADELPDSFLDNIREAAKSENPEAIIIGEVWEDASNKESYGARRRYLLGKQLDSVMNYPFRDAVLGFLTGENGFNVINKILSIVENYPPQVLNILMNHIGTHDTERAITILAGEKSQGRGREWQASVKLTPEQRIRGIRLLKVASAMQFTLPGIPCIYYGDEAGVEGYKDPFNRTCFPWESQNEELLNWYKKLGEIRQKYSSFAKGELKPYKIDCNLISYFRGDDILCVFNSSDHDVFLDLPEDFYDYEVLIGSGVENFKIYLKPESCCIIYKEHKNLTLMVKSDDKLSLIYNNKGRDLNGEK